MKIKLLASAQQDLLDGYGFYEQQAQGIGEYFLDSLYSDIDSLIVTAGIHPLFYERYFRLLSKHFPFAVYYTVSEDTIDSPIKKATRKTGSLCHWWRWREL